MTALIEEVYLSSGGVGQIWGKQTMMMKNIDKAYLAFCKKNFPLPSEKQVIGCERKLGRLPSDYRQFLLEYNGGSFSEPDIVPPKKHDLIDRLTIMHGIDAAIPVAELGSDVDLFTDNDPVQVLPIGHTMMGNLILLITLGDERDCIVMKKTFSQDYIFLARGIEEFFGLLREPKNE